MRGRIILPSLLAVWLVIGAIAALQRGYLTDFDGSCATIGSTVTTIAVGPLNYFGVNPAIECPDIEPPQPSE
ncbi:hypothetical protein [Nocardiopsis coralliicola]